MRQSVKYQFLTVPDKIRGEVRIMVSDRGSEYTSNFEGNKNVSVTLYPTLTLTLIKPAEIDENGNRARAPWNPNDSLGLTKLNLPTFANNLKEMQKDMKTPDLYTYHGNRLELNEALAEKIRKPFVIGNTTVELSAVVITQPDDSRIEGIKLKFNNEQSSVLLTLNELDALEFNISNIDVDSLAMLLYLNYITRPDTTTFNSGTLQPKVDILPKDFE